LDPLIKSQLLYHLSYAPSAALARRLWGARQPGRPGIVGVRGACPRGAPALQRLVGGCSSVVEQKLPKLRVEGSIPFTRSKRIKHLATFGRLSMSPRGCNGDPRAAALALRVVGALQRIALGFTDHARDLEVDGISYKAASTDTRTAIHGTADLGLDRLAASAQAAAEAEGRGATPRRCGPGFDLRHRHPRRCSGRCALPAT
jgi:hypothetical protein